MRMELSMKFLRLFLLSSIFLTTSTLSYPASGVRGEFVSVQQADGTTRRTFVSGPEDSKAAVLVVHDYFGISDATRQAVERLGSRGYRAMAIDLYGGKSASTHDEAVKLMQSLDRKAADQVLQTGLDQLKRPGRKIATL